MMKIGVLTSSRADFGIYLPLLTKLKNDDGFEVKIIAFGTHLSAFYGNTIQQIEAAGFSVAYQVESMLLTDSSSAIATAMGLTTIKFADFWKDHGPEFDLVFCLGDRYEMFAAVMAGVPFQIPFAHIHGGETTLGAIDNVFRHSITLASTYHFVSTEAYGVKIGDLTGTSNHIFYVGALSLDNLSDLKLLTIPEFKEKWGIDLSKKTILTTFHPETVSFNDNEHHVKELISVIESLTDYQVLITMPNADTQGNQIRQALIEKFQNNKRVFLIENLGSVSYFTAMTYCSFLLGNTSSGIIEAASFGKYVINLGNRQKGRLSGENVIHASVKAADIIKAVHHIEAMMDTPIDHNIYFNNGAANKMIEILKQMQ